MGKVCVWLTFGLFLGTLKPYAAVGSALYEGNAMKRILEDIKKQQFRTVYVLYGEEAYLKKQYRDKLVQGVLAEGDSMNYQHVQGKDYAVAQLIDFAETMPFLAQRRVIVMENTGILKSGGEELAEYFKAPCETTTWILVENDCDKRSRLYKAADKAGLCVEFGVQDANTLKRWLAGILKKEGKQIRESTLELFLEQAGSDMNIIRQELEKLLCYTMDKEVIEASDVEAACIPRITGHIFDMVDAIGMRNGSKALALYNELQALREPPARILYLIGRQMNILLQIKELKALGTDQKTMAAKVGVPPFAMNKYVKQAGMYRSSQLKDALRRCIEADEAIKTGRLQDKLSVELLIFDLTKETGKGKEAL